MSPVLLAVVLTPAVLAPAVLAAEAGARWPAPHGPARPSQTPAEGAAPLPSADSSAVLREAHEAVARFERLRVHRARESRRSSPGRCDERVGLYCLRLPRDRPEEERGPPDLPPEHPEVAEARGELIERLEQAARQLPADRWIAGQRHVYLAEEGRWDEALAAARACEVDEGWCRALEAAALDGAGRTAEAERAFTRVLERLPEETRRTWTDPGPLVDPELHRRLGRLRGSALDEAHARVWRLADPLFLVEGNELRTQHLSRRVLADIRDGGRSPHGGSWGSALSELLVRYGPDVAVERLRPGLSHIGPPPVATYYDPEAHTLMPDGEALERPEATEVGAWRTDLRTGRSRHAPAPAPRIRDMDVQLARFRRGRGHLVVAAWKLRRPPAWAMPDTVSAFPPRALDTGVFLLDTADLGHDPAQATPSRHAAPGEGERGTAVASVPDGAYLLSLEALDPEHRLAWRHRRGLLLDPVHPEVIALSDLLLVEPDSAGEQLPATEEQIPPPPLVDSLLPRAVPGTTIQAGRVEVVWEVYGIRPDVDDGLRFTLRMAPGERSFLRRAGERLGLVSSPPAISLEWEEGLPAFLREGEPLLRRVVLDLSTLDPGTYRLALTLEARGRTPVVAERVVEVTGRADGH